MEVTKKETGLIGIVCIGWGLFGLIGCNHFNINNGIVLTILSVMIFFGGICFIDFVTREEKEE